MSKIIVSKEIFNELKNAEYSNTDFQAIGYLYKDSSLDSVETVTAIRTYLNKDGYELEKTPQEKAISMYKHLILDNPQHTAFKEAMQWMDENFSLGLNFHLIDTKEKGDC